MKFTTFLELRRAYSPLDQKNFALLSGDFNPIHVDPIYARKTLFGQCVVHGIHNLLWVLEVLAIKEKKVFGEIDVRFNAPVFLGQSIKSDWHPEKGLIRLSSEGRNVASVTLSSELFTVNGEDQHGLEIKSSSRDPRRVKVSDVRLNDVLPLYFSGDARMATKMFPCLTEMLGQGIICQVASLSEVVGMQLPGLHSLFSTANIVLRKSNNAFQIKITGIDDRFKLVKLRCNYKDIEAKLSVFFRPSPVEIASCETLHSSLRERVNFRNAKALIIGGSRGLGAWIAKIIAVAGGEVTITYNTGKNEAEEVQADINKSGGKCKILKLDVTDDNTVSLPDYTINQIYYLASCKINENKDTNFNRTMHEKYHEFYVKGFDLVMKKAVARDVRCVLYPSSIFIDEPQQNFREYSRAKLDGEEICERLNDSGLIKIFVPRFPKMLTDQTASIIPSEYADICNTILPYLDEMHGLCSD